MKRYRFRKQKLSGEDLTPCDCKFLKQGNLEPDTQAEFRMMFLQAMDCQQTPGANRKAWKTLPTA